jgi:serine/threonine protein kinase
MMFSKKVWLDVLMQLLVGFERLSNMGITHNDIKLDNILLKVSLGE